MRDHRSVRCEEVRAAVFREPGSPALDSPAVAAHCATCAECAELVRDASLALSAVEVSRRSQRGRLSDAFYLRLRSRLRVAHSQALAQQDAKVSALAWFTDLWAVRPRLAWSLASALVAVVAAAVMFFSLPDRPLGVIGYVEGLMEIRLSGSSSPAEGSARLVQGAEVTTRDGAHGAIHLQERDVWWYLQPQTVARADAPRVVYLEQGTSWFDVTPGKGPFRVRTPHGEIDVIGTQFGVEVRADGMRVAVALGRVAVGSAFVEAGQQLDVSANGLTVTVTARAEGTAVPAWVSALAQKASEARFIRYYPSIRTTSEP